MKVVIVADINIAEDVSTCVLGYSSKNGWEEIDVIPRPLPKQFTLDEILMAKDVNTAIEMRARNDFLEEITGEAE